MKNLKKSIMLLFIFVSIQLVAQTKVENELLLGKIKMVSITELSGNPETEGGNIREKKYTFNEKGLLIEGTNGVMGTMLYKYDSNGNLMFSHDSQTLEDQVKDNRSYNAKNQLLEEVLYSYDGTLYEKNVNSYDKKGNLLKEEKYKQYDDGIKLRFRTEYKYNDKNLCIEKDWFSYDNIRPETYDFFSYDEKGNQIEQKHGSNLTEGNVSYSTFSKYDEKGRQLEFHYKPEVIDKENVEFTVKSRFDNNGKCIWSSRTSVNGKILSETKTDYDDKGNEISSVQKGDVSEKLSYEYQYDKLGNWIRKIEFSNGQKKSTVEREIVYF